MQCRNCKIMWVIMTDKDTISISDGHSFSTDPLLNIVKILLSTSLNGKYMRLLNQTRLIGNNFSWLIHGINRNVLRDTMLELHHFNKSHTNTQIIKIHKNHI